MREKLPDRRVSWVQKAKVGGQTVFLTFGEYDDGRLGEIFIDTSKMGSFARGALDALARMTSVALQCGTPVEEVVKALSELNFPPNGELEGSVLTGEVTSVVDWVAMEIAHYYCGKVKDKTADHTTKGLGL